MTSELRLPCFSKEAEDCLEEKCSTEEGLGIFVKSERLFLICSEHVFVAFLPSSISTGSE